MRSVSRRSFITLPSVAPLGVIRAAARPPKTLDTVRMGFIGVGQRGTALLRSTVKMQGVLVTALCDLNQQRLAAAVGVVQEAGQRPPAGYSAGPWDYRNLLKRPDLDAVLIATPNTLHAQMAVDAMEAGKAVLSEVPGAVTLGDCWRLLRTAEKTGTPYMLAENVCYYRSNMAVLNMVRQGLFGVWLESRSKKFEWEPFAKYGSEYDHSLWKRWGEEALKTGHRGADFFVQLDFVEALQQGKKPPIDVYDSAAWSAIIELSASSVKRGGVPVEFPDFTQGRWQQRRGEKS